MDRVQEGAEGDYKARKARENLGRILPRSVGGANLSTINFVMSCD